MKWSQSWVNYPVFGIETMIIWKSYTGNLGWRIKWKKIIAVIDATFAVAKSKFLVLFLYSLTGLFAELQERASRASVASYSRKFGKPSIQEILVITWPYASGSVQTLREGVRNHLVGGRSMLCIANRTSFRDEMSTLVTEKARDNNQRRPITLEEWHENFIAVVRK